MLFNSISFIFLFLPLALAAYYIVPEKGRNIVLLAASLLFYAWGEPVYVILLLFSTFFNYFCGRDIAEKTEDPARARRSVIFAVAVNVAILTFFKYYGFVLDHLNAVIPSEIPYRELPLPIGLSFYTFQAVSYCLDVYWKKAEPQKNFIQFAVYLTMFPKLIAGPVVRYHEVAGQLAARRVSAGKLGQGAAQFIIGLAKKAVIADSAGQIFEQISDMPAGSLSMLMAWIGCISFAFQIYFDFSGYSDMAIGLARMFGFEFRKNFNYPYISQSMTEFWRRWHISLTDWFREYVYIPMGGNRCTAARNMVNLMTVWLLTGLWHGAAWNFIVWGVYQGVFLMMEKYVWGASMDHWHKAVRHIYTLVTVMVGWVFFFSPSLGYALRYLGAMIGGGAGIADTQGWFVLFSHWLLYLLAVVGSTAAGKKILARVTKTAGNVNARTAVTVIVYIGIFFVATAYLVTGSYSPYIYFRF